MEQGKRWAQCYLISKSEGTMLLTGTTNATKRASKPVPTITATSSAASISPAKFNAVSTDFDHLIAPTNVEIIPIVKQLHQIARCVWFIPMRRLPPIANHGGWTSNG